MQNPIWNTNNGEVIFYSPLIVLFNNFFIIIIMIIMILHQSRLPHSIPDVFSFRYNKSYCSMNNTMNQYVFFLIPVEGNFRRPQGKVKTIAQSGECSSSVAPAVGGVKCILSALQYIYALCIDRGATGPGVTRGLHDIIMPEYKVYRIKLNEFNV